MKAYDGDQPFIFVSYAHADRDIVYPVIEILQNNGYHVWYDEGLHLGNDWRDELADRIQRCSAFIYMLSEQSVKSGYCKDEIYAADSEMKHRMDESEDSQIEKALQMLTIKLDDSVLTGGIKLVLDSRQMVSGIGASSEAISSKLIESRMLEECRDQFRYLEGINWGPAREGYYFDELPDQPVFNSVVDNPIYGDERHFLGINGRSQSVEDHLVNVVPGNTYTVRINYCNDGDPHLNSSGTVLAQKAKVSVKLPEKLDADKLEVIQAEISTTTGEYRTVWDQIALCCQDDVIIEYVTASAKIYNYGKLSGTVLSTELFSTGDYIGFNNISGVIPAGMKYSGYITFQFRVLPIHEVIFERTVSVDRHSFSDRVSVLPGDILAFRISMQNYHHNDILDVTFRDELPDSLELIPDTTVLYAIPDVEGRKLSDNIATRGINTGSFGKGVTGVIMYKAKVRNDITDSSELVSKSFLTFTTTKRDPVDRYTTIPDQVVRKYAQTSCFVKV